VLVGARRALLEGRKIEEQTRDDMRAIMHTNGTWFECTAITLVCVFALIARPAFAQSWPQKPVRIIYPYAAGGTGDAAARLLTQRLSQVFGQPFIVENRVGANGSIAAESVARAPSDGYTLLWAITPLLAINPVIGKVRFDPINDFIPISAVNAFSFALVVNQNVPVKTVSEFVNYVRSQPTRLTYAEGGVGSLTHLGMVLFLNRAGLKMTNVSYRGAEPALTDVVAGHLPAMFAVLGDARSQAAAGRIRLLAVSSEARSPKAETVPTMEEAGFPGFKVRSWHGLMAPAGTPKTIVERLSSEVARATQDPAYVSLLSNYDSDPLGSGPDAFAAMIRADIIVWAKAAQIAGIKPE
jgi:tripartite-type tricarboxylate transporter receptor subunit TctC